MNILFIYKSLGVGGVEVVSSVLANKFAQEGHRVFIFAFATDKDSIRSRIYSGIPIYNGCGFSYSSRNVELVRRILISNQIDVIINQWGLPLAPIRVLERAKRGLKSKVISVFHNDPMQNGRIQNVQCELDVEQNFIHRRLLLAKKFFFRCVTGYGMRYNYNHSDIFAVLSPSFVPHFQKFTKVINTNKLVVQTNPLTIDNTGFIYKRNSKEKEIIYVGRVDCTQKRVGRVIEAWAYLEKQFPEWCLTIVGDGMERHNIERMVNDRGLLRVSFEGFQHPRPYYERASILILTSEFEGFPLVLAECMSFGVVPVVYGSYSAVYDIIDNDKDGMIVPKTGEGFNAVTMAESCRSLMENEERLNTMALAAIEKSNNYSIDKIYEQWMGVMNNLLCQ